jgi:hypothetical protein
MAKKRNFKTGLAVVARSFDYVRLWRTTHLGHKLGKTRGGGQAGGYRISNSEPQQIPAGQAGGEIDKKVRFLQFSENCVVTFYL